MALFVPCAPLTIALGSPVLRGRKIVTSSEAEGFGGRMISTRDLSLLPDVDGFRRLLQSMAMLDAVLCPEWQTATTRSTPGGPTASRWARCGTAAGTTSSPTSARRGAGSRDSPTSTRCRRTASRRPAPGRESWMSSPPSSPDASGSLRSAPRMSRSAFGGGTMTPVGRWGRSSSRLTTLTRTDRGSCCPTWTAGPSRTGRGRRTTTSGRWSWPPSRMCTRTGRSPPMSWRSSTPRCRLRLAADIGEIGYPR